MCICSSILQDQCIWILLYCLYSILTHLGIQVELPDGSLEICKAKLLFNVCDLPAKAVLMNCNQFNGKHGCSSCKNEGEQTKSGRGQTRVYRHTSDEMRTNREHTLHAKKALENGEVSEQYIICIKYAKNYK